ncbi:PREDICTED: uncharacterized protein LOC105461064, partial [Wasmannia auropunctata]|uniref:uncharacterized protein LOC105461064 n=1 Tax=Wasmannia auropunctata TaxID=64793 RepID=UPI0005EE48A7
MHKFALATDIEKMYRQVLVHPDDRDLQRILWRPADTSNLEEFRLNTVTYGLACAPFLAIRTLRQLADDDGSHFPLGAAALQRDVYVDDVLTGAATLEEARAAANESALLEDIPDEHKQSHGSLAWEADTGCSTLGLLWHPRSDSFDFHGQPADIQRVTKRAVLSETARLFDPLGWLAPVIIGAKILIQSAWLQHLDWDQPVAAADERAWRRLREEFPVLDGIRVPRWMHIGQPTSEVEIHGFADASERAYTAVVYLRTTEPDGQCWVSLVTAKSKVAPLHPVSLPRLELCAATLLARLVKHVKSVTGLMDAHTVLWSDSTVALAWIKGHPSKWKTFVVNRVAHIQQSVPQARWRHLPGADNPADCASRGISPRELLNHKLWWHGPPWLTSDAPESCEEPIDDHDGDLPEQRARVHSARTDHPESEVLMRFSTLHSFLRVTAWCQRWLRALRSRSAALALGPLTASELEEAHRTWIRVTQATWFAPETRAVANGQAVSGRSPLVRLNPTRDTEGILRVGGRLKHALLSHDQRHPMILPRESHLTALNIAACHRRTLHGGVQLTLGLLRQQFWVPGGRMLVRRHLHRCDLCEMAGGITTTYDGQLAATSCHPDATVHCHRSVLRRTSVDPGLCRTLISDRGTNFVGADAKLRALFRAATTDQHVTGILANDGIEWRFNPPAAPHFSGIWEAAVKSVKHHLRRVIGDTTLTFEEMSTFLTQVEAVLNSRPLQALSDDPDDLTALTPSHFLIGTALNAVHEPSLSEQPTSRLSRWQALQQMRDHFWDR